MMQCRARDGPIPDRRVRKDRIHGQDVVHEGEVGAVIRDVAERDEADPQGNGRDQDRFGSPDNHPWRLMLDIRPTH